MHIVEKFYSTLLMVVLRSEMNSLSFEGREVSVKVATDVKKNLRYSVSPERIYRF